MRYPYCCTIRDNILNIETVFDLECEVDATIERDNGEWVVTTNSIFMNGRRMYAGTLLSKALADEIAVMAENDPAFCSMVIEDQLSDVAA